MKPQNFNLFYPISIIEFLVNFKLACDIDGVKKAADVWPNHFLMNEIASAVPNTQRSFECTNKKIRGPLSGITRCFTTNPYVANFILKKRATNGVIAATETEITRYAQPSGITRSQYSGELETETLHSGDAYESYSLIETFIEGLGAPVRHSMHEY